MGCAGSALVAAALAVEADPFIAASAALTAFGVAGEVAARDVDGPGSFAYRNHRRSLWSRSRDVAPARESVVKPVDLRLNAIIDPERAGGHDLVDLARRVAEGGATLVQLRDKRSETRAMIDEARAIKAALSSVQGAFRGQ